jgi:Glycosyl transferase family 90
LNGLLGSSSSKIQFTGESRSATVVQHIQQPNTMQETSTKDGTGDAATVITNQFGRLRNRFHFDTVNHNYDHNSNTVVMQYNEDTETRKITPQSTVAKKEERYDVKDVHESNDSNEYDDSREVENDINENLETVERENASNRGSNSVSSNDVEDEDGVLFQKEIVKNFNASLYSNYKEFISRSKRFPSVAERVRLYMSNWYLPPILPCDLTMENDPRIQYNYMTQVDSITNDTITIVLLQQSQNSQEKSSMFTEYNTSVLLQLDMIPSRDRNPFVYNETYIVKSRTDHFIQDAYKHFIPSLQRIQYPDTTDISPYITSGAKPLPPIPILLQMGDSEQYRIFSPTMNSQVYRPFVPIIKKYRFSMSEDELRRVTTSMSDETEGSCVDTPTPNSIQVEQPQRVARTVRIDEPYMQDYRYDVTKIPEYVHPIVSILSNYERHFNPLNGVVEADIPWTEKKNMAVFRGALTGRSRQRPTENMINDDSSYAIFCRDTPRCNLVLSNGQSQYVDAKLVANTRSNIPAIISNISIYGDGMNFQQMLEYKAIIMLEGNDVSTGLKWSLYSNSVVLSPKPTCTSWAMEELLKPYVHYIPLYDNLTNVEEQVQWMIEHDKEAEQIAYNGKLWMTDLAYHTDVRKDTEEIVDETFRRYMKHFRYNPQLGTGL